MKRKGIAVTLAVLTLALAGCGEKENVITRESTTNDANSAVSGSDEKMSEKGYVFSVNGVDIEIEAEAEEYIEALGDPVSYYEAASCAFGDLDKMYTYNGFELDTFSENGKDYVSAVILYDDTVSTKEGICIGDDVNKVKEVYGDAESTDDTLVYNKGNMKLCIFLKDDAVTSIEYLNTILD